MNPALKILYEFLSRPTLQEKEKTIEALRRMLQDAHTELHHKEDEMITHNEAPKPEARRETGSSSPPEQSRDAHAQRSAAPEHTAEGREEVSGRARGSARGSGGGSRKNSAKKSGAHARPK